MVDMFVGEDGPLVGCHAAEEGVGVRGATLRAGGVELVEEMGQVRLFGSEVWMVRDDEFWDGGRVAAHRLVVLHDFRFDEGTKNSSDQHAWRV